MREKENETYLGDSVCVSFDGQMLWLRTAMTTTSGSRSNSTCLSGLSNTATRSLSAWTAAPSPPILPRDTNGLVASRRRRMQV